MSVVDSKQSEYPTSWEQYNDPEKDWPYEVVPLNPAEHDDVVNYVGMHEFSFKAEDGDLYAGCYPRAMINNAAYTDQPLMIGASVRGNQAIPILPKERYRHTYVGGRTGEGKTVGAKNAVQQDGLAGNGFCFIDPGGEDIIDIVRCLPDYRLDDIIYMEPGNEYRDYSIGLNYLDTYHKPGQPGFKKECESIAMNLLPMLNADEYARMKGVASNMLRYLIKANHEDDEYEYTLIDLYYMLGTESAREAYAHHVEQSKLEFLKPYANKIGDLADDDLEPLIRRLQSWVENDVVRPFISQRDSDFSIADAIENQRIVLVKANLGKNERQTVTAALTTKIWSAVTSRPSEDEKRMMEYEGVDFPAIGGDDETGEHKPFFLVADEFHAVASENTDIGEMLAMARKKNLGLYILTQQLSQLSTAQQEQILGNCSTLIAFNPGRSSKEQSAIAAGFDNLSEGDLAVDKYTFWTTITDKEGKNSQPFLTNSTPPYPPVRTVKEANEALNRSQKTHGSKRLTDQEILRQVPDEFAVGAAQASLSGEDPFEVTDEIEALTAKALFDESIRQETYDEYHDERDDDEGDIKGGGWVRSDQVEERIRRYLPDDAPLSTTEKVWGELIEKVSTDLITWTEREDGQYLRCTADGVMAFVRSGSKQNAGGPKHRKLLIDAYVRISKLGLVFDIPIQAGGAEAMGDGHGSLADVDILPDDSEDLTPKEIHQRYDEFLTSDEYALLARLSDGDDVIFEAECSTAKTSPAQTVANLAEIINAGKRCIFLVREDAASNVYNAVAKEPRCFRNDYPLAGIHRAYNANKFLEIGGNTMYRESGARESVWLYNDRVDEYILEDSNGDEVARFDSVHDVYSDPTAYPAVEGQIEDYDEYTEIRHPNLPQKMFNEGEAPDDDAFDIIIVPRDEDDPLQIYVEGEPIPIADLLEYESGDEADISVEDFEF